MAVSKISTLPRFLYLNAYAFLLAFGGIGIAFIPCYLVHWMLVVLQIILVLICEKNAVRIFRSWKDKQRKYDVLMQRNMTEIRPDTFSEYVQAPCGRLLIKIVLADLHQQDTYKNILKLKQPLWKTLKTSCKTQKTVVYINDKL